MKYPYKTTKSSWKKMLSRCRDPRNDKYSDYGGRGITVCERWESFENFLNDVGERPPGCSIGRKDNDGNYEPQNCEWQTAYTQNRNKRSNVMLTFNGKTMCLSGWAEALMVPFHIMRYRHKAEWTAERIVKAYPCRWDKVFPESYKESWE